MTRSYVTNQPLRVWWQFARVNYFLVIARERTREIFGHKTKANVRIWTGTQSGVSGRRASLASGKLQFHVQSFTYTDDFNEQPEGREREEARQRRDRNNSGSAAVNKRKERRRLCPFWSRPFYHSNALEIQQSSTCQNKRLAKTRPRQNIYT